MSRIVLKPAGVLTLLGVFVVLGLLALMPQWLRQRLPGGVAHVVMTIGNDKDPVPWAFAFPTDSNDGNAKTIELRDGPEGATKAIHFTVNKVDDKPWNVQAWHDTPVPIGAGEPWEVRFYGRSPQSQKALVNFELTREPFDKSLTTEVKLTPQWQHFVLPFVTNRAYAARESKVSLQVGLAKGVYEFTGVELVRTGGAAKGGSGQK